MYSTFVRPDVVFGDRIRRSYLLRVAMAITFDFSVTRVD